MCISVWFGEKCGIRKTGSKWEKIVPDTKSLELPKKPVAGQLRVLRRRAEKIKACVDRNVCTSCGYQTGEWPEGKAVLENHQGIPLVHCPITNNGTWQVVPMESCSHSTPDVSLAAD